LKKFLIINPYGIGDVLFTTPIIRAIKESDRDNIICYWCNERVSEILQEYENIGKVFSLSRGDLKKIYQVSKLEGIRRFLALLREIKKESFQVTLDFSLDHRYSLVTKLLGIKKRIGFNYKKRGRFLTDKIDIDGYSRKHIVEYYLDLLKFIQICPKTKDLDLFFSEDHKLKAKQILARYGVMGKELLVGIGYGAGASWGIDAALKHWPPLRFAQLADKIADELGAKIIILGDSSERSIADIIIAAMKNKPMDLTGKTSLGELAAIISCLDLLVANDGGLLHMAVALNIKTVSIFGPVDDLVYGPYPPSPSRIVIKKNIPCRPCYQQFKVPICDKDKECLKSISTEEVYNSIREIL